MKDFYGLKVEEDDGVFLLFSRFWDQRKERRKWKFSLFWLYI